MKLRSLAVALWIVCAYVLLEVAHAADGSPPASVAAQESTALESIRKGEEALNQGRNDEAWDNFSKIVKQDPRDPRGHAGLAIVLSRRHKNEEALEVIDKAIKLAGGGGNYYAIRSGIYLNLGKYDLSIADANVSLLEQKRVDIYLIRATAFAMKRGYSQAIEDATRAIELNPQFKKSYANRAETYCQLKDWPSAAVDLKKYVELDPKDAQGYFSLGRVYAKMKRSSDAIREMGKAIDLDPGLVLAYFERAVLRYAEGDVRGAMDDYTKIIEMKEKPEGSQHAAFYGRGNTYMALKDYPRAIADYTQAIALSQSFPEYYNNRATAYRYSNDFKAAIADYKETIRINSSWHKAYHSLSVILATCPVRSLRDGRMALEYGIRAGDLIDWTDPDDLESVAAAYAELGDWDQAIGWQEKAVGMNSNPDEKTRATGVLEKYRRHLNPANELAAPVADGMPAKTNHSGNQ